MKALTLRSVVAINAPGLVEWGCVAESRAWFDSIVAIRRRDGVMLNVSNAQQAARLLMDDWPKSTGRTQIEAREAVLAALENYADARARRRARDAFAKAARDAGVSAD